MLSGWLTPEEETKAHCNASPKPTSTLLETPSPVMFGGVGPRVPLRHHLQTRLQTGRVGCGSLRRLRTLQAPLLSVLRRGCPFRELHTFPAVLGSRRKRQRASKFGSAVDSRAWCCCWGRGALKERCAEGSMHITGLTSMHPQGLC